MRCPQSLPVPMALKFAELYKLENQTTLSVLYTSNMLPARKKLLNVIMVNPQTISTYQKNLRITYYEYVSIEK